MQERTAALQERLEEFGVCNGGSGPGADRLPFVEWPRIAAWVKSGRLVPATDLTAYTQGLLLCL